MEDSAGKRIISEEENKFSMNTSHNSEYNHSLDVDIEDIEIIITGPETITQG